MIDLAEKEVPRFDLTFTCHLNQSRVETAEPRTHVDNNVIDEMVATLGNADLKDFTAEMKKTGEFNILNSRYSEVIRADGQKVIFKKSKILWLYCQKARKLSNDRTFRVGQIGSFKSHLNPVKQVVRKTQIDQGDWCIFKTAQGNSFLLGRVLSFDLLSGSNEELKKVVTKFEKGMTNLARSVPGLILKRLLVMVTCLEDSLKQQ